MHWNVAIPIATPLAVGHGFTILHRQRSHIPHITSVLMDESTLSVHRDLWVIEPKPTRHAMSSLTTEESDTVQRLRDEGDARLAQERIPWEFALAMLQRAVSELSAE